MFNNFLLIVPTGYGMNDGGSATLTPMHLRKAKLMFFWVRYPSSAILKMYFPDIKFNKNNTAQLVKWFSNFRYVTLFFDSFQLWGIPLVWKKNNYVSTTWESTQSQDCGNCWPQKYEDINFQTNVLLLLLSNVSTQSLCGEEKLLL